MDRYQGSIATIKIREEELVIEISIKAELMFRKLHQLVQEGSRLGRTE
jgi:hypothetical protein